MLDAEPRASRILSPPYLEKYVVVEFEKTLKAFADFSSGLGWSGFVRESVGQDLQDCSGLTGKSYLNLTTRNS